MFGSGKKGIANPRGPILELIGHGIILLFTTLIIPSYLSGNVELMNFLYSIHENAPFITGVNFLTFVAMSYSFIHYLRIPNNRLSNSRKFFQFLFFAWVIVLVNDLFNLDSLAALLTQMIQSPFARLMILPLLALISSAIFPIAIIKNIVKMWINTDTSHKIGIAELLKQLKEGKEKIRKSRLKRKDERRKRKIEKLAKIDSTASSKYDAKARLGSMLYTFMYVLKIVSFVVLMVLIIVSISGEPTQLASSLESWTKIVTGIISLMISLLTTRSDAQREMNREAEASEYSTGMVHKHGKAFRPHGVRVDKRIKEMPKRSGLWKFWCMEVISSAFVAAVITIAFVLISVIFEHRVSVATVLLTLFALLCLIGLASLAVYLWGRNKVKVTKIGVKDSSKDTTVDLISPKSIPEDKPRFIHFMPRLILVVFLLLLFVGIAGGESTRLGSLVHLALSEVGEFYIAGAPEIVNNFLPFFIVLMFLFFSLIFYSLIAAVYRWIVNPHEKTGNWFFDNAYAIASRLIRIFLSIFRIFLSIWRHIINVLGIIPKVIKSVLIMFFDNDNVEEYMGYVITGNVVSKSKTLLNGVSIDIVVAGNSMPQISTKNADDGSYILLNVPSNANTITFSKKGFKSKTYVLNFEDEKGLGEMLEEVVLEDM